MTEELNQLPDEAFALRLEDWLGEHCPTRWRDPTLRLRGEDTRAWHRILFEGGWRAPAWPREYGGMGLSLAKQIAYNRVMESFGVARTLDHGVRMVGPILMRHGTPEQQAHYLPAILTGEHQWCQGYSEPGAGSDLANLSTRAERDGEAFRITGQKIWTTQAADASHIYLLARTSVEERKQQGITLFLLPMNTPGITLRPIRNLMDEDEFYEVFLDEVLAQLPDAVGEIGKSWPIAKSLLGFERFTQGSPALAHHALNVTLDLIDTLDPASQASYEPALASLMCEAFEATILYDEICAQVAEGHDPQQQYSVAKLVCAELFQRIGEMLHALSGEPGGPADLREQAQRLYLLSRPVTIFGGTAEIQRNLLARTLVDGR